MQYLKSIYEKHVPVKVHDRLVIAGCTVYALIMVYSLYEWYLTLQAIRQKYGG